MDKVISELRFLQRILLAPTTGLSNDQIDFNSTYMDTLLDGRDSESLRRQNQMLSCFDRRSSKDTVVSWCRSEVERPLFQLAKNPESCQSITNGQVKVLIDAMNFFLLRYIPLQNEISVFCRNVCINLLVVLNLVLLASNREPQCKTWIREHMSEITSLKTITGDSILHVILKMRDDFLRKEALVRMLVEEGKMDVNVESPDRATPLHLLSFRLSSLLREQKPTDDFERIAELLIANGAHMDAMDVRGLEASFALPRVSARWAFNFNLKCLAARAILEHGVNYEKIVPKQTKTFILSHKPGQL